MFIVATTQNRMRQWISFGLDFPTTIDKFLFSLCCFNGIQHDIKISTGWIFHATRPFNARSHQTVFLIFHTAGSNGIVRYDITHIPMIGWIQHFIGSNKARLFNDVHMHLTNGNQTSH